MTATLERALDRLPDFIERLHVAEIVLRGPVALTVDTYYVFMHDLTEGKPVGKIYRMTDYHRARALAERMSKDRGFPLNENTPKRKEHTA